MVRPLQSYRIISIIAFSFLFTAFLLLLLVGLSLTIIKPIYLLSVESASTTLPATSIATELRFGVWGVCASSVLNRPTSLINKGVCFGPELGYTVPAEVRALIGIPDSAINAAEATLRVVLVLHPVAAGLAFVTFISALFLASHAVSIVTLLLAILTGLLSSIVFAIDLALVLVVKAGIQKAQGLNFTIQFGDGVWMVLAAMISTWIAVGFLSARACYCCGVSRKDLDTERY